MSRDRPEVLVVLHDVDDNLNELAPPLAEAGLPIVTWDVERDPDGAPAVDALSRFSGIISLGAYAGVPDEPQHPWMTHEKQLMQKALDLGMPVLGLCFGSQLLAAAAGAAFRASTLPSTSARSHENWRRYRDQAHDVGAAFALQVLQYDARS